MVGGESLRLQIELQSKDKACIDINYNHFVTASIYEAISQYDNDFANYLHEIGFRRGAKSFKLFVFSNLFPDKYSIKEHLFCIHEGRIKLFINSPINRFTECILQTFLSRGFITFGGINFEIKEIFSLPYEYEDGEEDYVALSPIVVTTGVEVSDQIKPRTVRIDEEKYVINIKNNLSKKYALLYKKQMDNDISIRFAEKYVKNNRGKLIRFKNVTLKGYIAPFKMAADKEVKYVALSCGLGENNSIGMGYIMEKRIYDRIIK